MGEKLGSGLLPAMDLQSAAAQAGWEQRGTSSPQGQGDKAAVAAVTPGMQRASGGHGGDNGVGWSLAQVVGGWVSPPMQVSPWSPLQDRSPSCSPQHRKNWISGERDSGDYTARV